MFQAFIEFPDSSVPILDERSAVPVLAFVVPADKFFLFKEIQLADATTLICCVTPSSKSLGSTAPSSLVEG
jgi:hypothetical protein